MRLPLLILVLPFVISGFSALAQAPGFTFERYKMIADKTHVSFHTILTHIKNIYEKLHVNSKGEAVSKAIKNRLV